MRRKTTPVKIGNLVLSSESPIMIQSMLNVSTLDTEACVEQSIRIFEAGGELVRITAQGVREAENLKNIRAGLNARGYHQPISADIHFVPEAALVAAQYVEKVRINPGNFVDKRAVFKKITYTDEEYQTELQHLKDKFVEFLNICREHGTAVRIGTNHGSLSDRIMSRYGNTPAGMVEATMEYLRICRDEHFDNVVISLKSSDCRTMTEAVRLLVEVMEREDIHYPLHLGVTEAGEGEDGRIRSAVGIGTLLCEGYGDTIRVSLTEAPEAEIPVAISLAEMCKDADYRPTLAIRKNVCNKPGILSEKESGYEYYLSEGVLRHNDAVVDFFLISESTELEKIPLNNPVLIVESSSHRRFRDVLAYLAEHHATNELVLKVIVKGDDKNAIALQAAAFAGGFFLEKAAHALWVSTPDVEDETFSLQLSKDILQSAGCRRYKAEFVSCPGCGRTLYDLEGSVSRVKKAFSHFSHLKIAVMGCIVNGPGEMGDADYGYVGAGNGKVNLYKGYECVKTGIPEENAIEELRLLIEENEKQ